MRFTLIFVAALLHASLLGQDASALAQKIIASHGGSSALLRTFTFTEVFRLAGKEKRHRTHLHPATSSLVVCRQNRAGLGGK